jgi:hypothetical protein
VSERSEHAPCRLFGGEPVAVLRGLLRSGCGLESACGGSFNTTEKGPRGDLDAVLSWVRNMLITGPWAQGWWIEGKEEE